MEKVGFGLIGTGLWGEMHAKVYSSHPDSELRSVCDIDAERAKQVAQKYNVKHWCTDYRELLERDDVLAVSVATPDFAHTDIVVSAIKAGKHVLVEKPLATATEDCEKILSALEASKGLKLMVDFHNRWNPPFVRAKEAITKGELGKLMLMYIRLNDTIFVPTSMLKWASKSEVIWFVGSHVIDLARWLFADDINKVYAVSRSEVLRSKGIDTPDFYQAILEFKGGGVATIENCWILPDSLPTIIDFKCELIGSYGAIYLDLSSHGAIEEYTRYKATYPDVFVQPVVYDKQMGFAAESIRHFIDCVINDKEPIVGAYDGYAVTKAISAIRRSSKTGEPVSVG